MTDETVTIRIDGFAHGGRGVGRVDGKAVFVTGALPGELVEAAITADRRRWAEGHLVRVLEPAEGRVEPPCRYVPNCGGCDLQHADPGLQLALLTRVVAEQLERLGGVTEPPVAPCRAVGPPLGYRRNVQLHANDHGQLGFHRAGTHDVVPIDRCLVAVDAVNGVLAELPGSGGADQVVIRADDHGVALVLHPGSGPLDVPTVAADIHVSQPDGTTVTLRGRDSLEQTVADIRYGYGAGDFFQVNADGA
ncbi:MAG: TRAM domain-containing protein, partial [Nitriliruptorales bacterium]|nr:TRAM domain-containing protein [Nitriliruptorales bacterium]